MGDLTQFCNFVVNNNNNTDEYLKKLSRLVIQLCKELKISSNNKSEKEKGMTNNLYLFSQELSDTLQKLQIAVNSDDVDRHRRCLREKLTLLLDRIQDFDNLFGWDEFIQWLKHEPSGEFADFIRSISSLNDMINGEDHSQINPIIQGGTMVNGENSEPVIGIITALEKEYAAVKAVFEEGREDRKQGEGAGRRYWLTDVVRSEGKSLTIAVTLADMGNNIAAVHAANMLHHYPTIKSIIMCGIAGGVPHPTKVEDHVRLGDIVISNKKGIVQYDFDKESQQVTEIRAMSVPPSAELLEAVRYLESDKMLGRHPWEDVILKALKKLNWQRPSSETDLLYASEETDKVIPHPEDVTRRENQPKIFLGAIGSANKLLKNPQKRDMLRDKFGVKGIEMEGSGVADATWNHEKGYLVVRGICDYCDEHKSDIWQQYASVVAAAYVRTLLTNVSA